MKSRIHKLKTPLKREDIFKLRRGDIVYLSGVIYTARDKAHMRALEYANAGKKLPFNLKDGVIFHAGPIVAKNKKKWTIKAVGPTTSSRMNSLEPQMIRTYHVWGVIGKGGMNSGTVKTMKDEKAVYFAMTGGCAVSAAGNVKRVVGVEWLDLGVPEAVWILEVSELGPLVVGIDSYGRSLYDEVGRGVERNLNKILEELL